MGNNRLKPVDSCSPYCGINIFVLKTTPLKSPLLLTLLIGLLLQADGILLLYKTQQNIHRVAQQAALSQGAPELQQISLSQRDYAAARIGDQEIFWKGKMFDVKSCRLRNGTVSLLVISDNEEDGMLTRIRDYTRRQHTPNGNTNLMQRLFSLQYLLPGADHPFCIPALTLAFQTHALISPVAGYAAIFAPPPRIV